ncbi:hypothetical protein MSP8886_01421 [Marinomonas spartinae]|uniref:Uncharacterized protein n=1 Tax=Marinomonas spartinae TaxID=1792290 RepID=A0A1A8TB86_9GAMM|nr:hypothetical protein [Marinomonas spartinae]SBS29060.1 hypothetical protein MSP8886_01421 [Marinomonas spartinae]
MKAILKFKCTDITEYEKDIEYNESDVCEIEAINGFAAEHGGYYGRPHGFRMAYEGSRYFGLCYGCTLQILPKRKRQNLRELVLKSFNVDIDVLEAFGCWLTSDSNFTGIGCDSESVYVLLDGARHGVRTPFFEIRWKAEWEYLETWLPHDAHPYDTRDQYANRSLENLKAVKKTYEHEMYEYERLLIEFNAPESEFMSESKIIDLYFNHIENVEKNRNEYHDDVLDEIKDCLSNHLALRGLLEKYKGVLDKTRNQIAATYFRSEPEFIFYHKMNSGLGYSTGYAPNKPFQKLKELN